MKNVILGLATVLMLTVSPPAMADIILDGSGAGATANLNDGAYVDGTPMLPQSDYAQEFAISGSGPASNGTFSGDILLGDIPVFDDGGSLFFVFVYDQQETGAGTNESMSLDDFWVTVGGTEYWGYDGSSGSVILNDPTANSFTWTPLGNGSDMSLYVPVDLFYGYGLLGSDTLTFWWTQSSADNGADEWVTVGDGFFEDRPICDPEDPDCPGPREIPEPTTIALFGMGLLGYAAIRRRRRAQLKA